MKWATLDHRPQHGERVQKKHHEQLPYIPTFLTIPNSAASHSRRLNKGAGLTRLRSARFSLPPWQANQLTAAAAPAGWNSRRGSHHRAPAVGSNSDALAVRFSSGVLVELCRTRPLTPPKAYVANFQGCRGVEDAEMLENGPCEARSKMSEQYGASEGSSRCNEKLNFDLKR